MDKNCDFSIKNCDFPSQKRRYDSPRFPSHTSPAHLPGGRRTGGVRARVRNRAGEATEGTALRAVAVGAGGSSTNG